MIKHNYEKIDWSKCLSVEEQATASINRNKMDKELHYTDWHNYPSIEKCTSMGDANGLAVDSETDTKDRNIIEMVKNE